MFLRKYFLISVVILLCAGNASAEFKRLINFQGKLTDEDNNVLTGSYDITFRLYRIVDAEYQQAWSEQHTGVNVQNGNYNVLLGSGSGTPDGNWDNIDFSKENIWLGITVGFDDEMTPRIKISGVPYCLNIRPNDINKNTLTGSISEIDTGFEFKGYGLVPVGLIGIFVGDCPTGWADCDGGTYGGIQTPDLQERFVVGVGENSDVPNMPGETYSVGDSGGSNSHILVEEEMADHQHPCDTGVSGSHRHAESAVGNSLAFGSEDTGGSWFIRGTSPREFLDYNTGYSSHSHSFNTGKALLGPNNQPHENRPPFYVARFCMKVPSNAGTP